SAGGGGAGRRAGGGAPAGPSPVLLSDGGKEPALPDGTTGMAGFCVGWDGPGTRRSSIGMGGGPGGGRLRPPAAGVWHGEARLWKGRGGGGWARAGAAAPAYAALSSVSATPPG